MPADYHLITNRWFPDKALCIYAAKPSLRGISGRARTAMWELEQVEPEVVRIRNRKTGEYLHAETEDLGIGHVEPGWWSGMWHVEAADSGYVRLRNRWRGTYLNSEGGVAGLGSVEPGWWSGQWAITPIGGRASSWISDNSSILARRALNRLVLPGTHDSVTRGVIDTWDRPAHDPFAPDTDLTKMGVSLLGDAYAMWARAQNTTVHQQLEEGIRYIDARVCADRSDTLRLCHGLYSDTVESMLDDIALFCARHPREPVIVDFNHFYDWVPKVENGKLDSRDYQAFRDSMFARLAKMLESKLGDRIVPNTVKPTSTLSDLWATGKSVVIVYHLQGDARATYEARRKSKFERDYIWASTSEDRLIKDSYADSVGLSRSAKYKFLSDELGSWRHGTDGADGAEPTGIHKWFFILTGPVTPTNEMYTAMADPTGNWPHGLAELARDTNPVVLNWVRRRFSKGPLNIIHVDHYHETCLVDLCRRLNGLPVSLRGCGFTDDTNWENWKYGYELLGDWLEAQAMRLVDTASQMIETVGDWFDEMWNGAKVPQPTCAAPPATLPAGVVELRVDFERMTCVASPDFSEGNELELFGSVVFLPHGPSWISSGTNKYLLNTRPGDRYSLSEESDASNHSMSFETSKYFYIDVDDMPWACADVFVHLYEHDDSSRNDPMNGETRIRAGGMTVGGTKRSSVTVATSDGDERVTLDFALVRTR